MLRAAKELLTKITHVPSLKRDSPSIITFRIKKIIEKGYARNQTEVIRRAILAYERMLEEEELMLVHKAVPIEMEEIEAGRVKTHSFEEIKNMSAGTNHTNK